MVNKNPGSDTSSLPKKAIRITPANLAETKSQLERGSKAVEVLKQNHSSPLSIEKQIIILFALTNGYIDDIETNKVQDFETNLYEYMELHHQDLMKSISEQKTIDDEISSKLSNSITEFKKSIA